MRWDFSLDLMTLLYDEHLKGVQLLSKNRSAAAFTLVHRTSSDASAKGRKKWHWCSSLKGMLISKALGKGPK